MHRYDVQVAGLSAPALPDEADWARAAKVLAALVGQIYAVSPSRTVRIGPSRPSDMAYAHLFGHISPAAAVTMVEAIQSSYAELSYWPPFLVMSTPSLAITMVPPTEYVDPPDWAMANLTPSEGGFLDVTAGSPVLALESAMQDGELAVTHMRGSPLDPVKAGNESRIGPGQRSRAARRRVLRCIAEHGAIELEIVPLRPETGGALGQARWLRDVMTSSAGQRARRRFADRERQFDGFVGAGSFAVEVHVPLGDRVRRASSLDEVAALLSEDSSAEFTFAVIDCMPEQAMVVGMDLTDSPLAKRSEWREFGAIDDIHVFLREVRGSGDTRDLDWTSVMIRVYSGPAI